MSIEHTRLEGGKISTPSEQLQGLALMIASLKLGMDKINEKLDGKQAVLSTEEAVDGFRSFLSENRSRNTCRSYSRLLSDLEFVYSGRNIPDISASELEEFLRERWRSAKNSTLKQNLVLLQRFFGWCSDFSQYRAQPAFTNPCRLINVTKVKPVKQPEFISAEKMKEFLGSATNERHWLAFSILLTAGLRVSELIGDPRGGKPGIKKKDVNGRVLTVHKPKSGRETEIAVIPVWVSNRLNAYMENLGQDDRVIDISYATLYGVVKTHSKWVGLNLKPHDLRKWVASFWSRQNEYAISNFVLRHSETKAAGTTLVSSLGARYIAPPSAQEAMERQDDLMTKKLLCGKEPSVNFHLYRRRNQDIYGRQRTLD